MPFKSCVQISPEAVLDQLAVAPFALEQGVMDVPPGGRQSFERGGISRRGGGVSGLIEGTLVGHQDYRGRDYRPFEREPFARRYS